MDPLVKREGGSASFCTKVAPCLWRADPSFMNSVTGSGYVAKYSSYRIDVQQSVTVVNVYPPKAAAKLDILSNKHSELLNI